VPLIDLDTGEVLDRALVNRPPRVGLHGRRGGAEMTLDARLTSIWCH